MYTLKSIVRRGTPLVAVFAMVAATVLPSTAAFADALNPLTSRSLLLSSSAPGYANTDGSGNSEGSPNANGDNWAPAGSGPNGQKTGETFSFKVSTDSDATSTPIKAFTLQYCTTAAGLCQAPGNNAGDARDDLPAARADNAAGFAADPQTSDLNVVLDEDGVGAGTSWTQGTGPGTFQIYVGGALVDPLDSAWTIATTNDEDDAYFNEDDDSSRLSGKNNYITLASTTGVSPAFNEEVRIVFTASTNSYITNPGEGAFFVKINTYSDDAATTILDGGVTVANVMTESIHITTKVLETMKFSVGTQNPDTQAVQHGSCDAIDIVNGNRLDLGNASAEYSLSTEQAYDVNSYWRLSSNSSGGASVYYSGTTLQNTVGDNIDDMDTKAHSQPGTEQFGLALVDAGVDPLDSATYTAQDEIDDPTHVEGTPIRPFPSNHVTPNISPLDIEAPYADADDVDGDPLPISDETSANNGQFAFKATSLQIPELIAKETQDVISCATSKVRYVANIAADTPSGVYTTKINYLAAPQY